MIIKLKVILLMINMYKIYQNLNANGFVAKALRLESIVFAIVWMVWYYDLSSVTKEKPSIELIMSS